MLALSRCGVRWMWAVRRREFWRRYSSIKSFGDGSDGNERIIKEVRTGDVRKAFEMFKTMKMNKEEVDEIAYSLLLTGCSKQKLFDEGVTVLEEVINERKQDLFSVENLIFMHCNNGMTDKALKLVANMKQKGVEPGEKIYQTLITACTLENLIDEGKKLHEELISSGMEEKDVIASALIRMYYDTAQYTEALIVYERVSRKGVPLTDFTYQTLLFACTKGKLLQEGKNLHQHLKKVELVENFKILTALIHFYCECNIFQEAFKLFQFMREKGMVPEESTFIVMITKAIDALAIKEGKIIHKEVIKCELDAELVIVNSLIKMYSEFGLLDTALDLFDTLKKKEVQPNDVTFLNLLAGCVATKASFQQVKTIYKEAKKFGLDTNVKLANAVIKYYCECDEVEEALKVLGKIKQSEVPPEEYTYCKLLYHCARHRKLNLTRKLHKELKGTPLIETEKILVALTESYIYCSEFDEAFKLYEIMEQKNIHKIDMLVTYILRCNTPGLLEQGQKIHESIIKNQLDNNIFILNALLKMYSHAGHFPQALNILQVMKRYNIEPDEATFLILLSACAKHKQLDLGNAMYEETRKRQLIKLPNILNALLKTFIECGKVEIALKIFETEKQQGFYPDEQIYLTLISGCRKARLFAVAKQLHAEASAKGFAQSREVLQELKGLYHESNDAEELRLVTEKLHRKLSKVYRTISN